MLGPLRPNFDYVHDAEDLFAFLFVHRRQVPLSRYVAEETAVLIDDDHFRGVFRMK